METELFSWESWDQADVCVLDFNNVVLKVQFGDFKPGTKFEGATVDYQHGQVQFRNYLSQDMDGCRPVGEYFDFKISLVVGEQIHAG